MVKIPQLLILALAMVGPIKSPGPPRERGLAIGASPAAQGQNGDGQGFVFRLSQDADAPDGGDPVKVSQGAPLSESETATLLGRLPAFEKSPDTKDLALRETSMPAPKTGEVLAGTFPPPAPREREAPQPDGPLEILRYAPEGAVNLAANISITFSQPMVPLSAHGDLALEAVPARLDPLPEQGRWRWLGTQTLVFDAKTRLPMATAYKVRIPSEVASVNGQRLDRLQEWSFSTPPPRITGSYPHGNGSYSRQPFLFLAFDQRIDPEKVLPFIRITAGNERFSARLATEEEWLNNPEISRLAEAHAKDRQLVCKPNGRLPGQSRIQVTAAPGLPSAEGPLVTKEPQSFDFRTFGPLKVTEHRCNWGNACQPLSPWTIQFSNPLDIEAFREDWVQVEPAVEGLQVSPGFNQLTLQGLTKGHTSYTVTLSPDIRDSFGQTLEKAVELSFEVGAATPRLFSTASTFTILDPDGPRAFSVYSTNYQTLRVRIYSVGPKDWQGFSEAMMDRYQKAKTPPGELVFDAEVSVDHQPDTLVETPLDLSSALQDGLGQMIIHVLPGNPTTKSTAPPQRGVQEVISWVQATQMGLDAFSDSSRLVSWTTDLATGAPRANVRVELFETGTANRVAASGNTDARGLVGLDLPDRDSAKKMLVARSGGDVAILPESTGWWDWQRSGWRKKTGADRLAWYVVDDRGMYRPGEQVHIKGWVRLLASGQSVDPRSLKNSGALRYEVKDSRGNAYAKGRVDLTALSGFALGFKIPDNANLGNSQISLALDGEGQTGRGHFHSIQVQEFRRPEFEVNLALDAGPHLMGDRIAIEAAASYYAGGPLARAGTRWTVNARKGSFRPPNQDDFEFGHWQPWWRLIPTPDSGRVETIQGETDAAGKHRIEIHAVEANPPTPQSLTVEAAVRDVNNQEWKASNHLLIHPSRYYVGLRSARNFVARGEPFSMDVIVADLDGEPIEGAVVDLLVTRKKWVFQERKWQEIEVDPQEFELRSRKEPVSFRFKTDKGGVYQIKAGVKDPRGRANETLVTRWVSGGDMKPADRVTQESAELIPNQKEYQSGDIAEILVRSPFEPAEGLLTLRRAGLLETSRFRVEGGSHTLKIPIEERYIPNLEVQVDLVGAAARRDASGETNPGLPTRPAYSAGSLSLRVSTQSRALDLAVQPLKKALAPGEEAVVDVRVSGNSGGGPTEVALIVVDEAVLALSNYQLADPLTVFYPTVGAGVSDYHSREHILLSDPDSLLEKGANTGEVITEEFALMDSAPRRMLQRAMPSAAPPMAVEQFGGGAAPEPIAVRTDFNPVAAFFPGLTPDGNGGVQVRFKLPDNLTRYRIMAIAVRGETLFGTGEATLTARLPLMVRPSPPRFLNFGDAFELPIILQNQTDEMMVVSLAARARNARFTEGRGRQVNVPANDRVEVRLPAASEMPGNAMFQVASAAEDHADAAFFEIPVWTPATTEAFATYGTLDEGAVIQAVQAPRDIYPEFGGMEITTSSTALQALTDAMLYLTTYPYDCNEQIASRILGVAALGDILEAFGGDFDEAQIRKTMATDLKALERLQNADGGFGFWRRGEKSYPYLSVHVAHALARAQSKGFDVPATTFQRVMRYLQHIDRHLDDLYSPRAKFTVRAYALWVGAFANRAKPGEAEKLLDEFGLKNASMEGLGWLLLLLKDSPSGRTVQRHLLNRVSETAAGAHFVSDYGDGAYLVLHSNRREDAVILENLIAVQPQSDLIPKLVRGLLAHRTKGRWLNTQENVFVLLALERYFQTFESQTPDFVARAWLGEQFAGEAGFKGRSADSHQVRIPMTWLEENADGAQLVLAKQGQGRLYYRLALSYAPASLDLKPESQGFFVDRRYEAVDDPEDVHRDEEGVWRIRAGARVKVLVSMAAPGRRYHVALVDPLPAGLEALNPSLKISPAPPNPTPIPTRSWWWGPWYQHQNLRDERAEAFTTYLAGGVYDYAYIARATTPGNFIVPPAKAEEMYAPETFGRSGTDRVIIQ